jgi:hypothetical protein
VSLSSALRGARLHRSNFCARLQDKDGAKHLAGCTSQQLRHLPFPGPGKRSHATHTFLLSWDSFLGVHFIKSRRQKSCTRERTGELCSNLRVKADTIDCLKDGTYVRVPQKAPTRALNAAVQRLQDLTEHHLVVPRARGLELAHGERTNDRVHRFLDCCWRKVGEDGTAEEAPDREERSRCYGPGSFRVDDDLEERAQQPQGLHPAVYSA